MFSKSLQKRKIHGNNSIIKVLHFTFWRYRGIMKESERAMYIEKFIIKLISSSEARGISYTTATYTTRNGFDSVWRYRCVTENVFRFKMVPCELRTLTAFGRQLESTADFILLAIWEYFLPIVLNSVFCCFEKLDIFVVCYFCVFSCPGVLCPTCSSR